MSVVPKIHPITKNTTIGIRAFSKTSRNILAMHRKNSYGRGCAIMVVDQTCQIGAAVFAVVSHIVKLSEVYFTLSLHLNTFDFILPVIGCLCPEIALMRNRRDVRNADSIDCINCVTSCLCPFVCGCLTYDEVATKYGIGHNWCTTLFKTYFCLPCSIWQSSYEIFVRKQQQQPSPPIAS